MYSTSEHSGRHIHSVLVWGIITIVMPGWARLGLGSDLLPGNISQGLGKLALECSCVTLGHLEVLWHLHKGHWGLWDGERRTVQREQG